MLINVARKGRVGRPSISTAKIRTALQNLVDGQMENIDSWLRQVAAGTPKVNEAGEPIRDHEGSIVFVVRPDALGAVKALSELAEFVIPKLSRSEATVIAQVEHSADVSRLSTEQLRQRVLRNLGFDDGDVIEGEVISQPENVEQER